MSIETEIFRRYRLDEARCFAYGVQRVDGGWRYERTFLDGAFRAALTIDATGLVTGSVIDTMTDEEYLPLRQTNPAGNYVYGVRYAYEELLRSIAEDCFVRVPFASAQANRISKRVRETWGDTPEFPWKEKAYAASGVFRHPATQKWYGLIMPVAWTKLVPGRDGRVEILNVKATDAARAIEQDGCYPAYHMNKRYWISIALDDTVTDEEVWTFLVESHAFSAKGKRAVKCTRDTTAAKGKK